MMGLDAMLFVFLNVDFFFQKLIEHIFIEHLLCTPDTDPDAGGTDTAEDKT